jgi:hypothetical protein
MFIKLVLPSPFLPEDHRSLVLMASWVVTHNSQVVTGQILLSFLGTKSVPPCQAFEKEKNHMHTYTERDVVLNDN